MQSLPKTVLSLVKNRIKIKNKIKKVKKSEIINIEKCLNLLKQKRNLLTKLIRDEHEEKSNESWTEFIEKVKFNPINSKAIWNRINLLRGKRQSKSIGSLSVDGKKFELDNEKAEVFGNQLKNVFSEENNPQFNRDHKKYVDEFIENFKFENQTEASNELFT